MTNKEKESKRIKVNKERRKQQRNQRWNVSDFRLSFSFIFVFFLSF